MALVRPQTRAPLLFLSPSVLYTCSLLIAMRPRLTPTPGRNSWTRQGSNKVREHSKPCTITKLVHCRRLRPCTTVYPLWDDPTASHVEHDIKSRVRCSGTLFVTYEFLAAATCQLSIDGHTRSSRSPGS
ncbi:hypothetical protein OG21DRAFT_1602676 [Imleria badia]|nr:hypothetical protein OG21DRAFT_1602676 [Imleria badia]